MFLQSRKVFLSSIVLSLIAGSIPCLAQQRIPLRVNMGGVSINKIPFIVADEEGIYEQNGLSVDQLFTEGSSEDMQRSGMNMPARYSRSPEDDVDAQIAITGGVGTVRSRAFSAISEDRIILATTDPVTRWWIFAQPEITRPEQLKGKRLGANGPGSMTHFIAVVFAQRMGWDPLHDISIMDNAMHHDVLVSRAVDAFVAYEVPHVMALSAGFKPLIDPRPWDVPMAGSGVVASRAWVQQNREAVRRFIKSTVDAIALMKNDRTVAFRAMAKWYNIADPEQQQYIYDSSEEMPPKPYPSVEGIRKAMEVYDSNEMRKFKPEDFYDDSFVKELDQSGYIDGLYR
jgi:ABC-type nitrate/sulfonate/bicarbonate transport system substrate-binding protein